MKIWYRYLLREILKVFFLFLVSFFFLYSLIDYSLHMQDFIIDKKIQLSHLITYYGFQFIKRADLLIPLSLLVATIKVLFSMNTRKELLALRTCGFSLKKILSPFFLMALLCMLFNFVSSEIILPSSLNYLDQFRIHHFKHSRKGNQKEPVHVLPLKDHSKIVYQKEDKENKRLIDVFWIRSVDEMWRMQSLSSDPKQPIGYYVDHLKRNSAGEFKKIESFETYAFSQFKWEKDPTGKGGIPLENRKITELFKLLKSPTLSVYENAQTLSQLLFKCTIPFFSFLILLSAAPFCLKTTRTPPIFLTYAIALFGFIAFFALMDAGVILGENRVLNPYFGIVLPTCMGIFIFGLNYLKTIRT